MLKKTILATIAVTGLLTLLGCDTPPRSEQLTQALQSQKDFESVDHHPYGHDQVP
ncbi:MAG: hypothetical protein ABWY00_09900 [Dongiaceae bacterium]